jgi:hypothetical protein
MKATVTSALLLGLLAGSALAAPALDQLTFDTAANDAAIVVDGIVDSIAHGVDKVEKWVQHGLVRKFDEIETEGMMCKSGRDGRK